jgi:hypothetical protein
MFPQFDGLANAAPLANKRDEHRLADTLVPALMGSSANTFTHRIKKELSICQSSLCLDLVSFPVLSQIKPQAPADSTPEAPPSGVPSPNCFAEYYPGIHRALSTCHNHPVCINRRR